MDLHINQREETILCLNDQGGQVMNYSKNVSGTLRAQMAGDPPLVFDNHGQDLRFEGPVKNAQTVTASYGMGGNTQALVLYENHAIDGRYTGPHPVSPTLSARSGTGGNNLPLVTQEPECFCIAGNIIDRQTADTLGFTNYKGIKHQYVSEDKCIVEADKLIRRLTPLECERLQGFPDGWTLLPDASDSARYKALGNSVAIPCVTIVLRGIVLVMEKEQKQKELMMEG